MNFGFKSTFRYSCLRIANAICGIPHTGWILIVNFAAALLAAYLYFGNYIIPATIGSKYHGDYYISIIETAMYFHFISSVYALMHLSIRTIVNKMHYDGSDVFILKLFCSIRQSSAIIMITLHLGRFMPRRGYTLRKETVYSFHHTSPQIISSINN